MTTPAIMDFSRRRLDEIEAEWNATGRLDEGQISFLIRMARAYFEDGPDRNAEWSGLSGCGVREVRGTRADIDVVLRWCQQAATIPHLQERIREAEARATSFARLRIALHDAIRRPLGVTPDSAVEFYDQRMADEAEERRAQQPVLRRLPPEEAEARAVALADAVRREGRGGSVAP